MVYDYDTNSYKTKQSMDMASLEVNPRGYCEEIFSSENLQDYKINPRILRRQIPDGFTDVISCIGNDFDTAQSACEGDSGSPVIRRISLSGRGKPFFQQEFIVATGLDCRLPA